MTEKESKENQVIRMQKLRRAVGRLRQLRSDGRLEERKESWFERLKARLGLGEAKSTDE